MADDARRKFCLIALVAIAIGLLGPAAGAVADGSSSGVAAAQSGAKDYSKNSATGDYARLVTTAVPAHSQRWYTGRSTSEASPSSQAKAWADLEAALTERDELRARRLSATREPVPSMADDFRWGDAGIGAGMAFGAMLAAWIALGASSALRRAKAVRLREGR